MRALAVLVLASLALAACGGDDEDKLDTAKIEQRIEERLKGAGNQYQRLDVDCPDEAEKKKGAKFDCSISGHSAVFGNLGGSVKVTVKDDKGEKARYESKITGENLSLESSGEI